MKTDVKLGRITGIPVGLNLSWFLVFAAMTWSLAAGVFRGENLSLARPAAWSIAAGTVLLFFGSVLLHELGHAWVARRNGIGVDGITLHIFGGVAQLNREPCTPGQEFRIAAAGPAANLLLALAFEVVWQITANPVLMTATDWLVRINVGLALFNLIPGFPLDGGRLARAAMWRFTGNYPRSTRLATRSGQVTGFAFIAAAGFSAVTGGLMSALWLGLIGWFLQEAAQAAYAEARGSEQNAALILAPCAAEP